MPDIDTTCPKCGNKFGITIRATRVRVYLKAIDGFTKYIDVDKRVVDGGVIRIPEDVGHIKTGVMRDLPPIEGDISRTFYRTDDVGYSGEYIFEERYQ